MHILGICLADDMGGAHKIAYELTKGIRGRGHNSHLAVKVKLREGPESFEIPNDNYRNFWTRFWIKRSISLGWQGRPRTARAAGRMALLGEFREWLASRRGSEDFNYPASAHLLDLAPARPDIIHAHNLHGGYFDLRELVNLSRQVPVVLTLHDEWAFTGHCSYTFDCERWEIGCGSCPRLGTYPALRRDGTAKNWKRKQDIYARSKLYVSASSRWLLDRARRSMLASAMTGSRVIPYGIDLSTFRPGDRRAARRDLGLSDGAKVVLFIANQTVSNQFKDYPTMEAAVTKIAEKSKDQEIIFLCIGEKREARKIGAAEIRYFGFESDQIKVARFYHASDLYLHAARAEAFGLVIAEAQACGLPVVATAVGGIPEVMEDKVTGYLVPAGDSDSMAEQALRLLNDEELRQRLGSQGVENALRRFDRERHVDDYLKWYQEILKNRQD